jgi:pentose-5-phosphate-3-epimerase
MAAKKSKTENYLSVENLRELADAMMALEEKSLKKWNKSPLKRGDELQELIETKFPGIGDEAFQIAMWVDLYIYTRDTLNNNDYYFKLMDVDEAIPGLLKYEKKNPDQFTRILEWVGDYGCLLIEGSGSDIGTWFFDWYFEPLFEVEALADKEFLFLDNPTKAQLGKLAKSQSARDRVQAALQTETDPELLKTLAQDGAAAVRMAAAMNPSTPEKVLDSLSRDPDKLVRKAALDNESISLGALESSGSESGSLSLASSKKATAESLAKLAQDKDEKVREAVASNKNTPAEVLLLLAKDKSSEVRQEVALNPSTPIDVLKKLAKDKDDSVRKYLTWREELSADIQKVLAKDENIWVRAALAENKKVTKEILGILSKDPDSTVRERALKNDNVGEDAVENFENPFSVKLAVAGNQSTPKEILEIFSTNAESAFVDGKSTSLMIGVAGNSAISEAIAGRLVKSKDKEVLKALASNPSLPKECLAELIESSLKKLKSGKSDWSDREFDLGLASNPKSPASYLAALLKHSDTWIVSNVAANPNLSLEKLAKLAKSEHQNIRKGVASNPKAPWALLQSLLTDEDCVNEIARNPATLAEDLTDIANRKTAGPYLLSDVGGNPSAPVELLEKLAKHKDSLVRLGVASNPSAPKNLSKNILEDFLTSESENSAGHSFIARCQFASQELIAEVMERYLPADSSFRSNILTYVAANPATGPEMLTKLAGDRLIEVRIAVAKNPNTPAETLLRLTK